MFWGWFGHHPDMFGIVFFCFSTKNKYVFFNKNKCFFKKMRNLSKGINNTPRVIPVATTFDQLQGARDGCEGVLKAPRKNLLRDVIKLAFWLCCDFVMWYLMRPSPQSQFSHESCIRPSIHEFMHAFRHIVSATNGVPPVPMDPPSTLHFDQFFNEKFWKINISRSGD